MTNKSPGLSPNLSADQAKATLQFLARSQMQGAEMPVYVDIFNTLTAIAAAPKGATNAPEDHSAPDQ